MSGARYQALLPCPLRLHRPAMFPHTRPLPLASCRIRDQRAHLTLAFYEWSPGGDAPVAAAQLPLGSAHRISCAKPRRLCILFGAGRPSGSGEEGLAWQKQASSSFKCSDQGHEGTSFIARHPRQNRLEVGSGRSSPPSARQAFCYQRNLEWRHDSPL